MYSSREQVIKTITFKGPDRLVYDLAPGYGTDFAWIGMDPSPDARPSKGIDEWGAVWGNIGRSNLGRSRIFPLRAGTISQAKDTGYNRSCKMEKT